MSSEQMKTLATERYWNENMKETRIKDHQMAKFKKEFEQIYKTCKEKREKDEKELFKGDEDSTLTSKHEEDNVESGLKPEKHPQQEAVYDEDLLQMTCDYVAATEA